MPPELRKSIAIMVADPFHHSSFFAGEPVAGAGVVRVRNGVIESINDRSGHYSPTAQMHEQVIDQLANMGVDTPK